jgi:hypothetical protein
MYTTRALRRYKIPNSIVMMVRLLITISTPLLSCASSNAQDNKIENSRNQIIRSQERAENFNKLQQDKMELKNLMTNNKPNFTDISHDDKPLTYKEGKRCFLIKDFIINQYSLISKSE